MDNENTPHQSSMQSLYLPQEIITEEILSRLPVKSLLRFRCVSKPLRSLIDSKRFAKTHLHNYTNNHTNYDHWRVILHCAPHGLRQHGPNQSSLRSYTDEPFLEPFPIDDPENNHLMSGRVVDCCNGLFCVFKRPSFFLWNPATRISTELPEVDLQNLPIRKWGFGWEEESGAYKVFVGASDDEETIARIYSSKTNTWRRVEHGSLPLRGRFGKVAWGKIHWLAKNGEHVYIELFDLKSEGFGMIELPWKSKVSFSLSLWEFAGCLRVGYENNDNATSRDRVWVMEEHGVKKYWVEEIYELDEKVTHTHTRTHDGCCITTFYIQSLVSPLLLEDN